MYASFLQFKVRCTLGTALNKFCEFCTYFSTLLSLKKAHEVFIRKLKITTNWLNTQNLVGANKFKKTKQQQMIIVQCTMRNYIHNYNALFANMACSKDPCRI